MLVVGVGTIGMLTVEVVRAMGAGLIIAADIDDKKLAASRAAGAAHTVNTKDPAALEAIRALTPGGRGVDIAFDAVGISDTVNLCMQATRLNGRIVLVGNLAPKVDFPLQWAVTRQLSFTAAAPHQREYGKCTD